MKSTTDRFSRFCHLRVRRQGMAALLTGFCLGALAAQAQNAIWNVTVSSDWNTPANWTPPLAATPTGPTGTATFGASSTTSLTFSQDSSVGSLLFETIAQSYTFEVLDHQLTITGSGVEAIPANAPTFDVALRLPLLSSPAARLARRLSMSPIHPAWNSMARVQPAMRKSLLALRQI
jgi:hypothetical protein